MVKQASLERGIFSNSMLEVSWAQRSRRNLSTLTSFAIEAVVLSVLILLSILKTVVMPTVQTVSTPIFARRAEPMRVVGTQAHSGHAPTTPANPDAIRFMQPSHIPTGIHTGPDEPVVDTGAPDIGIFQTGLPTIGAGSPLSAIPGTRPVLPTAPKPITRVFRTSIILQGSLIRRVQPVYPPLARTARIQGPVVLEAVISKSGTIEHLQLISGHPMLAPAAIEAVKQWLYRPYILNNEPIEVQTQITVIFTLSGN
ncbi:MAG TPA: energy transducer TonB [Candidatus Solibacter sp.]|nr:energy transducer TonB [Candidatus Solibacter sp.]